jgi:serpin B
MPRKQTAMIAAVSLAALTACSSSGGTAPKDDSLVRVDAARATVGTADLAAAATGANAFGVDVFHALADGAEENVTLSPTSLATVLAMVMPGAQGQTATQMTKAMHTTLPAGRFAEALGGLDSATVQRALTDKIDLEQYDSLWAQKGFGIQKTYLQTLASAFDTGVHETDFSNPDAALQLINNTVSDQTHGLIKDLFAPGSMTADTRLALTDALYFKAKWADTFNKDLTTNLPFTMVNGSTSNVPMMSNTTSYAYTAAPGWQYAELPYQKGHMAMGILLPAPGTFDAFRKALTADELASITSAASPNQVDLQLPKFTFDSTHSLAAALKSLGMTSVFDQDTADLSGVPTKPEKLWVGVVVQKTHVAVDEDGTTAAAASGLTVVAGAVAGQTATGPIQMHVDRPFLFLIRDTVSGQILFLGQVTDPRG